MLEERDYKALTVKIRQTKLRLERGEITPEQAQHVLFDVYMEYQQLEEEELDNDSKTGLSGKDFFLSFLY